MALTLRIGPGWADQVRSVWEQHPRLVPVVKGNGYGFGRIRLAKVSQLLGADLVAVGTIHELDDLPGLRLKAMVLTPVAASETGVLVETSGDTIFTVGSRRDAEVLVKSRLPRRAVVKLASPMNRYGATADELPAVLEALGREPVGYSLHLPLDGDYSSIVADTLAWLRAGTTLYVGHLGVEHETEFRLAYPDITIRQRIGTSLWLADKSNLQLTADVVAVRRIDAGEPAGYRQAAVTGAGSLVMVSAGSAHGVTPLADGRSPFHFARQRVALHEPSHMHTSMLFVPDGQPCPEPGDEVDVQAPLTRVMPDRVLPSPSSLVTTTR